MRIRKVIFEEALTHVSAKFNYNGYAQDGTFAVIGVPWDDVKHFSVVVHHGPDHELIRGLQRHEIANSLAKLGFTVDSSFWYQDAHKEYKKDVGYIYLVRLAGTDFYKIGKASHWPSRLKAFSVEFPIDTEPVGVWQVTGVEFTEYMLHEMHIYHHRRGEWFEFSAEDVEKFIELMVPISERVL